MKSFSDFLATKAQIGGNHGFDPLWMPDFLFDFQRHLVEWALRKGRAAIFADCGMGKSPTLLVWAENVVRKTNKPVLVLTPLAVGAQTVQEAAKFGVEAIRLRHGPVPSGARVVVTNYESLHLFQPDDFAGVVADESSAIKNFGGKRKAEVTEFMRTRPYRLLCTATAAPNDYDELGTSSEALGELGYQDMIGRFFDKKVKKDSRGWGRTKYQVKGHAVQGFWKWVCSWSRACRRPSDLGFDDGRFTLPALITREHAVVARTSRPGTLFDAPGVTLEEQREEQRRTLGERCEKVAELVNGTGQPAVCWCHLNAEGDELVRVITDAVQISGADDDDEKERKLIAFAAGQIRVLVTKPQIAGFGLNWQHCNHQTYFPSHSFEQYYQGIRRCWRFGQTRDVSVDVVTTDGGAGVLANLNRKAAAADEMFASLVRLMNEAQGCGRIGYGTKKQELPKWLCSTK